jgi:hypothetical protein
MSGPSLNLLRRENPTLRADTGVPHPLAEDAIADEPVDRT